MNVKNNEVRKLLNEMTKDELIDCIINGNARFYIDDDRGLSVAKQYLTTALLNRMEKINKIHTGDITKSKTKKEFIDIIVADEKKYKQWQRINRRVDQLMNT